MTLLEQFAKISEKNENLLNDWAEKYKMAQQLINQQKEEIINLKNQNFKLKERLKVSSDHDRNLLHRMNFGGNRNWSDEDYEDREARIDRILEMNPGI